MVSEKVESPVATARAPLTSMSTLQAAEVQKLKEDRAYFDNIFKQVMEPVLQYTEVGITTLHPYHVLMQFIQTFVKSAIDPAPPAVPLLTMIRLNEAAFEEVELRRCPPLETFLLSLRMSMWPVFQKAMGAHVDSLKALADSAGGSFLIRGNVGDSNVQAVRFT